MTGIDKTGIDQEPGQHAARIVQGFYRVLVGGDPEQVAAYVEDHFTPDATLSRPASLPGGGTRAGAGAIAKFLRAAAGNVSAMTVRAVSVTTDVSTDASTAGAGDVQVFAEIDAVFGETSARALERWSFEQGRCREMTVFYWDTAAMLTAAGNPPTG